MIVEDEALTKNDCRRYGIVALFHMLVPLSSKCHHNLMIVDGCVIAVLFGYAWLMHPKDSNYLETD